MNNFPVQVNGKEWWVSRSIAVAVSIYTIKDGKICVLANKRGTGLPGQNFSNPGKWSVVTGFLDYDETLKQCAIREVHEETGVWISDVNLKLQEVEDDPKRDGQVVLFRYSGFLWNGGNQELTDKFSEPKEVAEIKWVPIQDIDNYKWTSKNHVNKIKNYGGYECWRNGIKFNEDWSLDL